MIVIDSSAVVAVMFGEPEAGRLVQRLSQASTLERVLVARDAPFGELYDLGAIASFYDEAGLRVARDVASLRDRPVQSGWMWERSAETDLELVACGLALGYPLESTAALLLGTGP